MVALLIFIVLGLSVGLLSSWRRNRRLLLDRRSATQVRAGEQTNKLEKANEDLKRAQAELQRRWQYLAEAQRISHSGTFGWKVRSGELVWSDEAYSILGFTRETNPTLDLVFERTHPEDLARVRQLSDRATQTGMDLDVEHRILLPDGVIKYVHAVAHAGRDNSGELEYMGVVTDITDRKRAEKELQAMSRDLQESKAWLEEAQRVAHVGYWVWDLETNRLIWSDETYRIFGLTPQEGLIDLDKVREMIHPDDREAVFRTAEEAIRSGTRADCEHRLFRPSGELRVVHSLADLKKNSSGRPYQMFGTTQDITDRKRAEDSLQRSQFYLAEAQSLAHIGSWATNFATGQILHISDETFRLYGFDPRQGPVPYERFYAIVHPEDEPAVRATLENAIRTRADYDHEFRICLPDGNIRFHRAIGHRNPSGELGEYFGVTMDITERKQGEQEREKVRQLEADLAHINRLNMMGELAAALAHEIKQPIAASITSASACLRWLAHDPPDLERARAAAARMKDDGNRAADVINHLRSFYKKDTPPQREIVDVKGVVRELTTLLRNEAFAYSITIHPELDGDASPVLADRVQLQQVFMNLMLNAIEAMKDKGGELTIWSRPDSEGHLVFSVSDTGVGLPAESCERIFDAFLTTKPQGMGMGLAITRSIVESHGGRIWATANQGAGATFHFTIPVEAEAHA